MRRYYRLHATIYDATRWTFLLGRNEALQLLTTGLEPGSTVLEVGCGTGRNLRRIAAQNADCHLIGVDVSPDMLARARKATAGFAQRVQLVEQPYGTGVYRPEKPVDAVLFSYALTMFNPGWEAAIQQAYDDLRPGGRIVVADFHDSHKASFQWWMHKNHVRMNGHLLPQLQTLFQTEFSAVRPAWTGAWRYVVFVGKK